MTNTGNNKNKRLIASFAAIFAVFAQSGAAWAQQQNPAEWLERMSSAVGSTSYQGTVIRRKRGESEALKVVHKIVDGVVNERVTSQEGNGIEIIRIGNEVHCILPDKKSVLVEGWNNQSTLFSPLPRVEVTNTPHYDVSVQREGRIAGRNAVMIAVRPHDEYRYAHRIWVDEVSGFPLQTEILDIDGVLIEEVKFADISISDEITVDALGPSVDLSGYTWYREPARYEAVEVETNWACDDLPAGFRPVSTRTEKASGAAEVDAQTTHIVYSDGVANVSVFIESSLATDKAGWAAMGASNSFSVQVGGYQVTAMGEVPGITVQRIASSMRQQ